MVVASFYNRAMRLLVIEDHAPLRRALVSGLSESGFEVVEATDGEQGWREAENGSFDVIVLDLMLPKLDGITLLKKLRAQENPVHVLVLTAMDTVADRVRGLDVGADDYLVKPFAFPELLARVHALVRRKHDVKTPVIRVADLEIDTRARTAQRAGQAIELSAREYAILEFLAYRRGRVVSRDEIWESVYDFAAEPKSNVVDVYIGYLRKKLDQGGAPGLIHTRRGMGYVLDAPT
jgi:DNA-binding response OmpR family regulator